MALNYAQVITIGLTCAMIVTEAVGFPYRIRHIIPATAALMLAIAALLCLRIAAGAATPGRGYVFGFFGWLFVLASVAVVAATVLFIGTPLSLGALGVAALLTLLLAIPETPASD